ncbi:hypothetical protein U8607_23920 [Methylobacterium durans]|uniref:hypothetical protein n=1 Tax=Methylobacterium durans TaxID=2202825 RepID=UPI002AFF3AC3|nr:hypothetical protein [Methylobacterium durans]MEA1835138.1 hypothetical protein [Methylobacterium durans]
MLHLFDRPTSIHFGSGTHRPTRTLAVALLIALSTESALAISPFEGRYHGPGEGRLDLQMYKLGDGSDIHFVIAETTIPNECSGEVRGLAMASGQGTFVLRQKDKDGDEVCTLTLRFSPDGKRVRMTQQDCGNFHGASCDFVGTLKRR